MSEQYPYLPPVPPAEVRIESVGLRPIDRRRVDVAVDLTPCSASLTLELVIVGPNDDELCSILLVDHRQCVLDRVMHLRQDASPGLHTLHVGVFQGQELLAHAVRRFAFYLPEEG